MTNRLLQYIVGALGILFISAGCEQANIYSDVDFNVTLDQSNTYVAGEPVRFNISGNPDNLLFYSGEIGHAYEYHERYEVPVEQVKSMILDMQIQHRYGTNEPALEIWYTNQFEGLLGTDGVADLATVKAMEEAEMPGWKRIDFDDPGEAEGVFFGVTSPDMKDCVDNFCIAFHWNPNDATLSENASRPMDTYWVNGVLTIDVEGMNPLQYSLKELMGIAVCYIAGDPDRPDKAPDNIYWLNQGNGSIRLDVDHDISFNGGYYRNLGYDCESWIFSYPRAFNVATPDQGVVIKNIQNYLDTYEYTFTEPGTYTVTFVGTNSNYIGESRDVQEFTVNIVPPAVTPVG